MVLIPAHQTRQARYSRGFKLWIRHKGASGAHDSEAFSVDEANDDDAMGHRKDDGDAMTKERAEGVLTKALVAMMAMITNLAATVAKRMKRSAKLSL